MTKFGTSWFATTEAAVAYYATYMANPGPCSYRNALDWAKYAIKSGTIHIGTPTPHTCKAMLPGDRIELDSDKRWHVTRR